MRMRMATRSFGVIVPVLFAALALSGAVGARGRKQEPARPTPTSTMTGVYTAAQAAKGETTYMNVCVGCHSGKNYASEAFTKEWSGERLVELFDYLRTAMPKSAPGSLSAAENAQIVAYLLKINRVPPGKVELPTDHAALQSIVIEFPSAR
jgi:mono/diheme cytochrome c family protein